MRNEYGLDVRYFENCLKKILRDVSRHTPDEMARSLFRLGCVASSSVINEEEFSHGNDDIPDLVINVKNLETLLWAATKTAGGELKIDDSHITQKTRRSGG